MGLKSSREFMIQALTGMLLEGETLYDPFYGCLEQRGLNPQNYFGFFGRTDSHLLIAILHPFDGKKISWYNRVPLEIKEAKIKKSWLIKQYTLKLYFFEGKPCRIRMAKRLLCGDFYDQEMHVENTLRFFERYTKQKL